MRYQILALFFISISINSCLSPLDLDDVFEEKVIIEGNILKGERATVTISKSISKTAENIFPRIENAQITLTTDDEEEILQYTNNGIYVSTEIIGKPGKTYEIKVEVDNIIYRAQSTMPEQTIWLDSIGFKQDLVFAPNDSIHNLLTYIYSRDEISTIDYGMFGLQINQTFVPNWQVLFIENNPFECPYFWNIHSKKGAILDIRIFQMDEPVYQYFSDLQKLTQQINLVGLTVAPPSNLKGNFSNQALGYFGAMNTDTISRILGD